MEKGFNDEELADIMNEIESLEDEFTQETKSATQQPVDTKAEEIIEDEEVPVEEPAETIFDDLPGDEVEPVAEVSSEEVSQPVTEVDSVMSEVVTELASMPVEEVTGSDIQAHDDEVHHLHPIDNHEAKVENMSQSVSNESLGHSKMNFTVEGDMKLDLSFNVGGKVVGIKVSGECFEIELDGGMKFSVPLDSVSHQKAA